MKVWQLIERLSKQPAGCDVVIIENQNDAMEPLEIVFFADADDFESNCYIHYKAND